MAWPSPDLPEEGASTLLAGEGSCRASTALIKCLNGEAWAVPRWRVVDIVPALWGFQDDPDSQMGTDTDGQPGTNTEQNVKSLCVYVHVPLR